MRQAEATWEGKVDESSAPAASTGNSDGVDGAGGAGAASQANAEGYYDDETWAADGGSGGAADWDYAAGSAEYSGEPRADGAAGTADAADAYYEEGWGEEWEGEDGTAEDWASEAPDTARTYDDDGDDAAEEAPAEEEWHELRDEEGNLYYFNAQSGASQWEEPTWVDEVDEDSGVVYYRNTATGESQWARPVDFVPIMREEACADGWEGGFLYYGFTCHASCHCAVDLVFFPVLNSKHAFDALAGARVVFSMRVACRSVRLTDHGPLDKLYSTLEKRMMADLSSDEPPSK